jgi:hypothetical protein
MAISASAARRMSTGTFGLRASAPAGPSGGGSGAAEKMTTKLSCIARCSCVATASSHVWLGAPVGFMSLVFDFGLLRLFVQCHDHLVLIKT